MRAVGELQIVAHRHPGRAEAGHLGEERARVDDEAVADDVQDAIAADSRGDEPKREVLVAELDGVPGIVSALVAPDEIEGGGDQIDDFPLALVAPLAADHDDRATFVRFHRTILARRTGSDRSGTSSEQEVDQVEDVAHRHGTVAVRVP